MQVTIIIGILIVYPIKKQQYATGSSQHFQPEVRIKYVSFKQTAAATLIIIHKSLTTNAIGRKGHAVILNDYSKYEYRAALQQKSSQTFLNFKSLSRTDINYNMMQYRITDLSYLIIVNYSSQLDY